MTTVYIVTSGQYSDYRIEEVFSSEELADRYVAVHDTDRWGYYEVQPWELDSNAVPRDSLYRVSIETFTGESEVTLLDTGAPENTDDRLQWNTNPSFGGSSVWYRTWVTTKDAETARKVGSERWAQVLAGQVPVALWTKETSYGPYTYRSMAVPERTDQGTILHDIDSGDEQTVSYKENFLERLAPTDTPLLKMMSQKVTIGGGPGNMMTWGWGITELPSTAQLDWEDHNRSRIPDTD